MPLNPGCDAAHALLADARSHHRGGNGTRTDRFRRHAAGREIPAPDVIRIDLDPEQMCRGLPADIGIVSDARPAVEALCDGASQRETGQGAARVRATLDVFENGLSARTRAGLHLLETVRDTLPGAIIVGDSTQPVYSGCLGFAASTPSTFFCSATGYGTLGYALPAAIGAKLGNPARPWSASPRWRHPVHACRARQRRRGRRQADRHSLEQPGYGEIKSYMQGRDIEPLGVDIFTPDFARSPKRSDGAGTRQHGRRTSASAWKTPGCSKARRSSKSMNHVPGWISGIGASGCASARLCGRGIVGATSSSMLTIIIMFYSQTG